MSLIQEALKRKADEESSGQEGLAAAEPTPEKPAPAPPAPEEPRKRHRPWVVLTGIALLMLILFGGAALLLWHADRRWESTAGDLELAVEPAPELADPEPVETDTVPESFPDATIAAAERIASLEPDRSEKQPSPPAEPLPADLITDVLPVEGVRPPDPPVAAREALPEEARPVEAEPPAREPVTWPALTLDGVVYDGRPDAGSVHLNRRIVGVGESVDGVRVLSVAPRGAELSYQGETRFLQVGKTLP